MTDPISTREPASGPIEAIVSLDPPIMLHGALRGQSYAVRVGGNPMTLFLPLKGVSQVQRGGPTSDHLDIPEFPAPPVAGGFTPKVYAGSTIAQVVKDEVLAATALRLRSDAAVHPSPFNDWGITEEFLALVTKWLATVRDWLAAWSGNARDTVEHDPRPVLQVVRLDEPNEPRLAAGGRTPVIFIDQQASGSDEWRAALEAASQECPVPLQHRLLAEARMHAARQHNRQAVISACTAAEVALAQAAEIALLSAGRPADDVADMLKRTSGLADLFRLNATENSLADCSYGRALHQLAEPRNRATHGGETPNLETVQRAIRTAGLILAVSPLPRPASFSPPR